VTYLNLLEASCFAIIHLHLPSEHQSLCRAFFSERRVILVSDRCLILTSQAIFSDCQANLSSDRAQNIKLDPNTLHRDSQYQQIPPCYL